MSAGSKPAGSKPAPPVFNVVQHVLGTILGFDNAQIAVLKKKRTFRWNGIRDLANVQQFVDLGALDEANANEWRLWIKYALAYNLEKSDAAAMTPDDWDAVDILQLEADYAARPPSASSTTATKPAPTTTPSTSIPHTPPPVPFFFGGSAHPTSGTTPTGKATVTAMTCTVADVQHTYFLKYANVSLTDVASIASFYKSLQTQGLSYNIFLRPYELITKQDGVVPDRLNDEVRAATAISLYAKIIDTDVISATFKQARHLLSITTDGYVFLEELLRMVHPMLSVTQIASVNIPNFSDTRDIYSYAAAIVQWCEKHLMKNRKFTYLEVTEMFLDHLDDSRYDLAISTCRAAARNYPHLPVEYRLPTIATTLAQMVPLVPPPQQTEPKAHRVDTTDDFSSTNHDDDTTEPLCCRVWRNDYRRDGPRKNDNRRPPFRGTCKACGVAGHHAPDCRFLKKLQQCLAYLEINPRAADEKKKWKGRNSYQKNRSYVRALQDNLFIPYDSAPPDIFLNVVDDDHDVFEPNLLE